MYTVFVKSNFFVDMKIFIIYAFAHIFHSRLKLYLPTFWHVRYEFVLGDNYLCPPPFF